MVLMFGSSTLKPSIAEATEMGGVIIPSASKALPPMMAGNKSHLIFVLLTKAYKANIPPSPLLSALNVSKTYLMVVCMVSVQKIHEIPPSTTSLLMGKSPTMALRTYKGEVPMSP